MSLLDPQSIEPHPERASTTVLAGGGWRVAGGKHVHHA